MPKRSRKQRLKCEGLSNPLSNAASVTVLPKFFSRCRAWSSRLASSHFPGDVLYIFRKSLLKADTLRQVSFAKSSNLRLKQKLSSIIRCSEIVCGSSNNELKYDSSSLLSGLSAMDRISSLNFSCRSELSGSRPDSK